MTVCARWVALSILGIEDGVVTVHICEVHRAITLLGLVRNTLTARRFAVLAAISDLSILPNGAYEWVARAGRSHDEIRQRTQRSALRDCGHRSLASARRSSRHDDAG